MRTDMSVKKGSQMSCFHPLFLNTFGTHTDWPCTPVANRCPPVKQVAINAQRVAAVLALLHRKRQVYQQLEPSSVLISHEGSWVLRNMSQACSVNQLNGSKTRLVKSM